MAITYYVYANAGDGGPVDYTVPVATLADVTAWQSGPLAAGGWTFAVRAANDAGEEANVNVAADLVLDGSGRDTTNTPGPPIALSAIPLAGGQARLDWCYPATPAASSPTGFHVYQGVGAVSYAAPVATVAATWVGAMARYTALVGGLSGGVAYAFGVRAFNGSGEETNTITAAITAKASGPSAVRSLAIEVLT